MIAAVDQNNIGVGATQSTRRCNSRKPSADDDDARTPGGGLFYSGEPTSANAALTG